MDADVVDRDFSSSLLSSFFSLEDASEENVAMYLVGGVGRKLIILPMLPFEAPML